MGADFSISEIVMTIVNGTPVTGKVSPARVDDLSVRRQVLEAPRPRGMEAKYLFTGVHLSPDFSR